MANRRTFLRTAAGGAVGLLAASRPGPLAHAAVPQTAPAGRREVSIAGRRVKVVDLHCHCVVPEVAEVVKGTQFANNAGGGGNQVLGPARIQLMDKQGVDVQALTINGYWWYAADRDLARKIVQAQNDGLAK